MNTIVREAKLHHTEVSNNVPTHYGDNDEDNNSTNYDDAGDDNDRIRHLVVLDGGYITRYFSSGKYRKSISFLLKFRMCI